VATPSATFGFDIWSALDEINGVEQPKLSSAPPMKFSSVGIPMITRAELLDMGPTEVAIYFYDRIIAAAMRDDDGWLERLRSLPQLWRLTYSVCWLQTEVDNGGIEQFFSNGNGNFDDETEADLRCIKAGKFLNLFTRARRLYYSVPGGHTERLAAIEPIDQAFYKKVNLYTLVGNYVLNHLQDYCTD
jgi:hypothetical protein